MNNFCLDFIEPSLWEVFAFLNIMDFRILDFGEQGIPTVLLLPSVLPASPIGCGGGRLGRREININPSCDFTEQGL